MGLERPWVEVVVVVVGAVAIPSPKAGAAGGQATRLCGTHLTIIVTTGYSVVLALVFVISNTQRS